MQLGNVEVESSLSSLGQLKLDWCSIQELLSQEKTHLATSHCRSSGGRKKASEGFFARKNIITRPSPIGGMPSRRNSHCKAKCQQDPYKASLVDAGRSHVQTETWTHLQLLYHHSFQKIMIMCWLWGDYAEFISGEKLRCSTTCMGLVERQQPVHAASYGKRQEVRGECVEVLCAYSPASET